MTFDITSLQNDRVKHIVKLREDKRQRQRDGLMLVEGWDELTLALASGLHPRTIFTAPELLSRAIDLPSVETISVSRAVFEKMSHREGPDGWLGVFPIPKRTLDDLLPAPAAVLGGGEHGGKPPLVIVAESVEKPGNLGAILRTADAAGVDALLVCDPRVDLWNPNVIRASRGAAFAVPTVETDNASALAWLKSQGMQVLAATPSAHVPYTAVDLTRPTAIAVGTEDEGLTDFWMSNADLQVLIPMFGQVNSLNVSVSTALITYEAVRQRTSR